jgi:hypothetical protein
MRWNPLLQPNFEHEAAASLHTLQPLQPLQPLQALQQPARRWWLGWLQLLFAWVVCMLLCANIALVFAEGLPQAKHAARSGKPVGCAVTGSPAPHGPERAERAGPAKGQTRVC